MMRYFNPTDYVWDGPNPDFTPTSDNIPWCQVPEKKITPEDVKYVLSSHFQGTPYDPYLTYGDPSMKGAYRSIGINRNDFMALIQIRPEKREDAQFWSGLHLAQMPSIQRAVLCGGGQNTGVCIQYYRGSIHGQLLLGEPSHCGHGRRFLQAFHFPH